MDFFKNNHLINKNELFTKKYTHENIKKSIHFNSHFTNWVI